jgi:hypothetical protein
MKYWIAGSFGFLLGAAAAGAVLYFNPLTAERAPDPASDDRALTYKLPDDMLAFMRGDFPGAGAAGAGDDTFWEETIDRTALLGLVLDDSIGVPAAVASRLIAGSSGTDLLLRGVLVSDHWLLTIPGEGSLYVRAESNVWPFLKDGLIPTWFFGRPWDAAAQFRPTAGPGPQHTAIVIGATGKFASLEGRAVETYRVTTLDPVADAASAVSQLHLRFFQPLAADTQ